RLQGDWSSDVCSSDLAGAWHDPPPCRVCPHVPARSRTRLCFLHSERWHRHRERRRRTGREVDFDAWLAAEQPFPGYGACRVVARSEERRVGKEGGGGC